MKVPKATVTIFSQIAITSSRMSPSSISTVITAWKLALLRAKRREAKKKKTKNLDRRQSH